MKFICNLYKINVYRRKTAACVIIKKKQLKKIFSFKYIGLLLKHSYIIIKIITNYILIKNYLKKN